jgi:hypothetical protein
VIGMTSMTAPGTSAPSAARTLLACGVLAGPCYLTVGLAQALTRDGFDIRRHPLSVLSNGDLGWIQVGNFVVSGLLVLAAAIGLGRAMTAGPGRRWGPGLIAGYGVGLLAAGAFAADPFDGFPVGTPAGPAESTSWHGVMHFVAGGVGFFALIGACLVFARRFAVLGRRGWAGYSAVTGVLFLAAFVGIASGNPSAAILLAFTAAVVLGWTWLSLLHLLVLRGSR